MALTIVANDSAGINFNTYLTSYFAALTPPNGTDHFYGGVTANTMFGPFDISGEQIVLTYGSSAEHAIIGGGGEFAYDFLTYGPSFGHGYSGTVDSLTLGTWVDG